MEKLQETRKNNKGFSLVELIIVIAIMAVLIAILAPQFIKYVEESRQSADLTTVEEIINAVQAGAADPSLGIEAGSIEIQTSGWKINDGSGGKIAAALTAAQLDTATDGAKLKSSEWGKVTITIDSKGTCTVASDGSTNMKTKYKK